jgi:hypothetical protein
VLQDVPFEQRGPRVWRAETPFRDDASLGGQAVLHRCAFDASKIPLLAFHSYCLVAYYTSFAGTYEAEEVVERGMTLDPAMNPIPGNSKCFVERCLSDLESLPGRKQVLNSIATDCVVITGSRGHRKSFFAK